MAIENLQYANGNYTAATIDDMTYGMDINKMNSDLAEVIGIVRKIKDTINRNNSESYKTFESAVAACWNGEDRVQYMDKLTTKLGEVWNNINQFEAQIESVYKEAIEDFLKFQANHDVMGGGQ